MQVISMIVALTSGRLSPVTQGIPISDCRSQGIAGVGFLSLAWFLPEVLGYGGCWCDGPDTAGCAASARPESMRKG